MPMNNFNTGRDLTLNLIGYNGTILAFGLLTDFDAKMLTNKVAIKGMDGIIRYLEIPDGWDGSFGYTKQDDQIDAYFAGLEANYYAGQNVQASSVTETIQNPDGSISQYRFTGVMMKYDDAGAWRGDNDIKVKISWCASKRLKVQ
jgi:hypothetical protein